MVGVSFGSTEVIGKDNENQAPGFIFHGGLTLDAFSCSCQDCPNITCYILTVSRKQNKCFFLKSPWTDFVRVRTIADIRLNEELSWANICLLTFHVCNSVSIWRFRLKWEIGCYSKKVTVRVFWVLTMAIADMQTVDMCSTQVIPLQTDHPLVLIHIP